MQHLTDSALDAEITELRAEIRRRRDGLDESMPNGRDYERSQFHLFAFHMAEWHSVTDGLERRFQGLGAERQRRRDANVTSSVRTSN